MTPRGVALWGLVAPIRARLVALLGFAPEGDTLPESFDLLAWGLPLGTSVSPLWYHTPVASVSRQQHDTATPVLANVSVLNTATYPYTTGKFDATGYTLVCRISQYGEQVGGGVATQPALGVLRYDLTAVEAELVGLTRVNFVATLVADPTKILIFPAFSLEFVPVAGGTP